MTTDATQAGVSRSEADWEAVERAYRAGVLSIREIAAQHGLSDTAIRKRAKKEAWARDLTARVREQVRAELVRTEVRTQGANPETEAAIVAEAAAPVIVLVREHRKEIKNLRAMGETLLEQLEAAAGNRDALEALIIEDTAAADDPDASKGAQAAAAARRAAMLKAVSLPSHASILKDLATVMKSVVPLERQAFNVDEPESPDDAAAVVPSALSALTAKLDALAAKVAA